MFSLVLQWKNVVLALTTRGTYDASTARHRLPNLRGESAQDDGRHTLKMNRVIARLNTLRGRDRLFFTDCSDLCPHVDTRPPQVLRSARQLRHGCDASLYNARKEQGRNGYWHG